MNFSFLSSRSFLHSTIKNSMSKNRKKIHLFFAREFFTLKHVGDKKKKIILVLAKSERNFFLLQGHKSIKYFLLSKKKYLLMIFFSKIQEGKLRRKFKGLQCELVYRFLLPQHHCAYNALVRTELEQRKTSLKIIDIFTWKEFEGFYGG